MSHYFLLLLLVVVAVLQLSFAQSTDDPTPDPTLDPSAAPTFDPSATPTPDPSAEPTPKPTPNPSPEPTPRPSSQPSSQPSRQPSTQPTSMPSNLINNANNTLVDMATKDVNTAIFSGYVSAVVAALRDYDAQSDKDNVRYTSISSAIFYGHSTMVDVVIDAVKMDVNSRGPASGNTFLMWAAHWGQLSIAEALVKKGADATLRNKDGETALSLAAKAGHRDIVKMLRSYGATV